MRRALQGDRSERLAELFILSSALYYRMLIWPETDSLLPETFESCRLALNLTSLDLAREESRNCDSFLTRNAQLKTGLAELILGIEDLCSDEYADKYPQSCFVLRKRREALEIVLQRLA